MPTKTIGLLLSLAVVWTILAACGASEEDRIQSTPLQPPEHKKLQLQAIRLQKQIP